MLPQQDATPTITPIPIPGLDQQLQVVPATPTPIPAAPAAAPVVQATPLPGTLPGTLATPAPAAGAITNVTQQPNSAAALLALAIYLTVFGVMGYRRGWQRGLIVLVVSLGMFFLLQRFSPQIVSIFDKFGKGVAFLLGQPIPDQSPLGVWAAANTATLLVAIWLLTLVATYILTDRLVKKSKKDGWAFLLGLANGLVVATVFAPLLTSLIFPESTVQGPIIQLSLTSFLSNIWQATSALILRIWTVIQPYAQTVFFVGLIVLVLLAAFTLRTSSAKPKS